MRESLPIEVEAFLRKLGPSTAKEIAMGVRARRVDVDELLDSEAFQRVSRPEGGSPRATYFSVSRRVPRAEAMLSVLRDGQHHSRSEIVRRLGEVGASTYTNNAATELRLQGFDVRSERRGREVFYWIAEFPGEVEGDEAA